MAFKGLRTARELSSLGGVARPFASPLSRGGQTPKAHAGQFQKAAAIPRASLSPDPSLQQPAPLNRLPKVTPNDSKATSPRRADSLHGTKSPFSEVALPGRT